MTERLEEIKTRFNAMKELESFKKLAPTDLFFDDLNWLLQQAELAVGLEHELEAADKQEEQWEEIISTTMHWKSIYEKEAQRYKQALEEIKDLYPLRNVSYVISEIKSIVNKALEGEENE